MMMPHIAAHARAAGNDLQDPRPQLRMRLDERPVAAREFFFFVEHWLGHQDLSYIVQPRRLHQIEQFFRRQAQLAPDGLSMLRYRLAVYMPTSATRKISSAVAPCWGKVATPKLPLTCRSFSVVSVAIHSRRRSERICAWSTPVSGIRITNSSPP